MLRHRTHAMRRALKTIQNERRKLKKELSESEKYCEKLMDDNYAIVRENYTAGQVLDAQSVREMIEEQEKSKKHQEWWKNYKSLADSEKGFDMDAFVKEKFGN